MQYHVEGLAKGTEGDMVMGSFRVGGGCVLNLVHMQSVVVMQGSIQVDIIILH